MSICNVEKEWRGHGMQLLGLNFIKSHSHAQKKIYLMSKQLSIL